MPGFRIIVLWVLLLPAGNAGAAEPVAYTPSSDDTVLERAATPRDADGAALRELRAALAQRPDDLPLALRFARTAIDLGRAEQDPRYFGYAESALQPWLRAQNLPLDVRLLRAVIRQWRHQFSDALQDLDAVIAAGQAQATEAHLIRASLRLVAGDPAAAVSDCAALIGHSDLLIATVCIANANSLRGRAVASLSAVETVLVHADGVAPDLLIWAQTSAAEIALRLGDAPRAQQHYEVALRLMDAGDRRDPYLLASWADAQLQWQQPALVIARLTGLQRIDNLLLRLAMAECRSGAAQKDACAAHTRLLADRFNDTQRRGDFVHQREQALFLLELRPDIPRALAVASDNWQQQREPIDAAILLRAAAAAQQPAAAQTVLDWMQTTGIEDQHLQQLSAALSAQPQR